MPCTFGSEVEDKCNILNFHVVFGVCFVALRLLSWFLLAVATASSVPLMVSPLVTNFASLPIFQRCLILRDLACEDHFSCARHSLAASWVTFRLLDFTLMIQLKVDKSFISIEALAVSDSRPPALRQLFGFCLFQGIFVCSWNCAPTSSSFCYLSQLQCTLLFFLHL